MGKHVLVDLRGSAPAPRGDGDLRSWFLYYKWPAEVDEDFSTFIPRSLVLPGVLEVDDTLWFAMDGDLLGCAALTSILEDHANGTEELWYTSAGMRRFSSPQRAGVDWDLSFEVINARLPDEVGESWMSKTVPALPSLEASTTPSDESSTGTKST